MSMRGRMTKDISRFTATTTARGSAASRMIGGTSARAARSRISTGSNACAVVVRSRTIGSSAAASTGTDEALPKPSPRRRAAAAARSSHHSPKLSIMAAAITPSPGHGEGCRAERTALGSHSGSLACPATPT